MINLKKFFTAIGFFFLLSGCQKDDICPESTQVTPLLIIEFYDVEDNTRLKAVQSLTVQAVGEEEPLSASSTTNQIAIPLRTDQNTTQYEFIRNSGAETENIDTISFFYNPSPEYLNRACGFKVNFLGLQAEIVEDDNNWILDDIEQQTNVENETETAHLHIIH